MTIQKVRHCLLILAFGLLSAACGGGDHGATEFTAATLETGVAEEVTLQCDTDTRTCVGGKLVFRDPENNCEFCPCTAPGMFSLPCGDATNASSTKN